MIAMYPIGTVIKLKNKDLELVIIGYARKELESGLRYDYIGVHASYGMSLSADLVYFNYDHIDEVLHEGYKDNEYEAFATALEEKLQLIKEERSK